MKIEIHVWTSDGSFGGKTVGGGVGDIANMINALRGHFFDRVDIAIVDITCQQDCQKFFDVLRYVSRRIEVVENNKRDSPVKNLSQGKKYLE